MLWHAVSEINKAAVKMLNPKVLVLISFLLIVLMIPIVFIKKQADQFADKGPIKLLHFYHQI
jgi:hypothetical protein